MKHTTYNTKLIILIAVLFFVSCFVFYNSAMAQVKLETALPDLPNAPASSAASGLPGYIKYLFIFGLAAITFVALAQMMIGGITYILAAGNVAKVEDAKDTIKQALLGLGLLLVSYLLLRTINPDLVNLRNPTLVPTHFKERPEDKPVCTPSSCPSGCKTECVQGVWDDKFCGCQTKKGCTYSQVTSQWCVRDGGKGIPMSTPGTPCEILYKSSQNLYKDKVCCEICP